jgi:undecaprenyl-diphosphatase
MLRKLEDLDTRLFLLLNEKHDALFDLIMYWASNQYVWIPLYLWLIFLFYRSFGKGVLYYLFWIVLLEVTSDQLSSHLIKNWACRPRPSHVASLIPYIHLSAAGPGGEYGFVSGHACNAFALAIFLIITLPRDFNRLKWLMIGWALLVSYSRIYNGVHYPGDVLGGVLLGSLLGWATGRLFGMFVNVYLIRIRGRKPS